MGRGASGVGRPKVFLSYSHDSEDHRSRVREAAVQLEQRDIDVVYDGKIVGGSPSQGFPRWMLDSIECCGTTICIFTEKYARRFLGRTQGEGKGADWEGAVLLQRLYDEQCDGHAIIPCVLGKEHRRCVPAPLSSKRIFDLLHAGDIDDLIKLIHLNEDERLSESPGDEPRDDRERPDLTDISSPIGTTGVIVQSGAREIVVRLDGDLDDISPEELIEVVRAIKAISGVSRKMSIQSIDRGSINIRMAMHPQDADAIVSAYRAGLLARLAVTNVRALDVAHSGVVESIGAYKLEQLIGRDAFSEVFSAVQQEPFRRRVAIKVLRGDMETPKIVRYFKQESHILASLDNPNIVRIFDAGIAPSGTPYTVMEYLNGVPITTYCEQNRLSVRERLELFIQLCGAVDHLHCHLVIHRDIKPSNVLVAAEGGDVRLKLTGFDVAATVNELPVSTEDEGELFGTLEYMSPEQADGGSRGVDCRTDVYALGALLYELLTGAPPMALPASSAGVLESLRVIREVTPLRPSERVALSRSTLPESATKPDTGTRSLRSILRGDLDCIVMKCLRKEPNGRYRTAAELATDVQYYLEGRPVLARPTSFSYVLRKFIARHRFGCSAVLTIVTMFAVSIMFALVQRDAVQTLVDAAAVRSDTAVGAYLTRLGRSYFDGGFDPQRFALAEEVLLRAHTVLSQYSEPKGETRDCVQSLVDLYAAWHVAEPDRGYDQLSAQWKAKLDEAH